jgi:hypothetical protein
MKQLTGPNFKRCPGCDAKKSPSEFNRDRSKPDGLNAYCKLCHRAKARRWHEANRERRCARMRAYHHSTYDYERTRDRTLRYRYGIGQEDYDRMYAQQKGRCALCNVKRKKLHVDHEHESGKVRGLLCNACNSALNYIAHRPEWAPLAIEYLTTYGRGLASPELRGLLLHECAA